MKGPQGLSRALKVCLKVCPIARTIFPLKQKNWLFALVVKLSH
jgi:hypothetical protein